APPKAARGSTMRWPRPSRYSAMAGARNGASLRHALGSRGRGGLHRNERHERDRSDDEPGSLSSHEPKVTASASPRSAEPETGFGTDSLARRPRSPRRLPGRDPTGGGISAKPSSIDGAFATPQMEDTAWNRYAG